MKQSVLHVGGHADGEYRDVELVDMAVGGWQLSPGYTLKDYEPIDRDLLSVSKKVPTMEIVAKINETHYVRDRIHHGGTHTDFYIHYRLRAHDESALVKALVYGYRKPKGE
jgi:hypothetical protein